ncbi:MAG: DNA translocase FtsK [Acholeplasmatales bacterium]|nr:DNA translocase FtsK [Acholeplasmatales bacterium]
MKKKKIKEELYIPLLMDEEPFEIYQLSEAFKFNLKKNEFRPTPVVSMAYGTAVDDEAIFTDNAGVVDVDMNYDYIRKDEEKHISEDEIIKRFGTKYYEFQMLNHEKAREILGGEDPGLKKPEKEAEKPEKKKKGLSLFEEDVDDFLNDKKVEEAKEEKEEKEEERSFDIRLEVDDTPYEYGKQDERMPKPTPTNIPSFLTEKKVEKKEEVVEEEFNFEEPEDSNDFEFTDMPSMEAPEIEFYDNPPVDRNISIEEAIRRANEMETKEALKPEVKPQPKSEPTFIAKESKYKDYHIDYADMFKKSSQEEQAEPAWLEENKDIINLTLQSFGIAGEVIHYTKGPAFTLYEIMLDPGVNVKKVNQIKDNLAMNLQVTSLRILCPIPGKNTVGVEAPNEVAEMVKFGDIIDDKFVNDKKPMNVALGKDINGNPVYQDITDMPHALIAGATKSGKSVSINTILVSLLIKNSPDKLKLILVDPKMVEMTFYRDIPHLAVPVITDLNLAGEALKWACEEMDRRYEVFARNRVRNIEEYNNKRKEHKELENMPYILAVIDEFNDLVLQVGAEVNDSIVRLAQKARACGMHIILATQRPTVQVVNGTIKANIPCRIAFRVASQIDSNTILDEVGAENLLGRGDMLIKNNGAPLRAQGAYISDNEICAVCDYLVEKYGPDYMFNLDDLKKRMNNVSSPSSLGGRDVAQESEELLYQIAQFCVDSNACSINSIQNAFQLGFNRASRIVTMLEDREIVSPKNGTKSREILVDTEGLRRMFGVDED